MQVNSLLVFGILEMSEGDGLSQGVGNFHEGTVVGSVVDHDRLGLAQELVELILRAEGLGGGTNLKNGPIKTDFKGRS